MKTALDPLVSLLRKRLYWGYFIVFTSWLIAILPYLKEPVQKELLGRSLFVQQIKRIHRIDRITNPEIEPLKCCDFLSSGEFKRGIDDPDVMKDFKLNVETFPIKRWRQVLIKNNYFFNKCWSDKYIIANIGNCCQDYLKKQMSEKMNEAKYKDPFSLKDSSIIDQLFHAKIPNHLAMIFIMLMFLYSLVLLNIRLGEINRCLLITEANELKDIYFQHYQVSWARLDRINKCFIPVLIIFAQISFIVQILLFQPVEFAEIIIDQTLKLQFIFIPIIEGIIWLVILTISIFFYRRITVRLNIKQLYKKKLVSKRRKL